MTIDLRLRLGACALALSAPGLAALAHDPQGARHARDEHDELAQIAGEVRTWHDLRRGTSQLGTLLAVHPHAVTIEGLDANVASIELADLAPDELALALLERAQVEFWNESDPCAGEQTASAAPAAPWQAQPFALFAPFVRTRWDERWLYVESDGLPHAPLEFPMMVGIRAWQQQVPLPQPYSGTNAWQIPLHPELASEPVSARTQLRRGAIALAANGIPIFNALNNRGEDAHAIGELDEYGGHCGRADDYHYHMAPLALQRLLGRARPLGFALDGLALYGLFDPEASAQDERACPLGSREPLDELGGHACSVPEGLGLAGGRQSYHYHASTKYPYINGGMRGRVTVDEDQIVPQPRAQPLRPSLTPLRGARITGFAQTAPRAWSLRYELASKSQRIDYRLDEAGAAHFDFVAADGTKRSETYARRDAGSPRREAQAQPARASGTFELHSPAVGANGALAARFTCDGESLAPPFEWSGAPPETKSFALTLHHVPPEGGEHVYLVVWDLPATLTGLAEDQGDRGVFGINSVNRRAEYAPPCSQGPGEKLYVATLYALSAAPALSRERAATRAELLAAIETSTLGTASLEMRYSRRGGHEPPRGERRPRAGDRHEERPQRGQRPPHDDSSFKTEVPAHDHDLVLARPTDHSITISASVASAGMGFIEYRRGPSEAWQRTPSQPLLPAQVSLFELDGLAAGAEYVYELRLRDSGDAEPRHTGEHRFVTRRAAGSAFTFTIQADSHLDENVTPALYLRTLTNALAERPDFHIDLGDTFMTDKRRDFHAAAAQYEAQRYDLGTLCHSAALFLVLGNHDGESGSSDGHEGMSTWSYAMRTQHFPPPLVGEMPGSMYSGRTSLLDGRGANHYAFEWGDALFIVLDPFWPTTERPRGRDAAQGFDDASWSRTLGREQYDWLAATLERSHARHRFVFTHHLVGGRGREARGGAESAPYFEWGGANADGSDGFAAHRPGWPMPIHELLRRHGVEIVFHGHDHMYVRNERDGIVYQCVPQPGNALGGTRSAEEYGYRSGTILGSPGHVRVRVTPAAAEVDFVRSALEANLPGARGENDVNGAIAHSYRVVPRTPVK